MTVASDLHVRPATVADAAAIAAVYNHYVASSTATFDTVAKSVEDRERWIVDRDSILHPVLVAEEAGQVIAWGALSPYRSRAAWSQTSEVAVYIDSEHTGRGIGPLMVERLVAEAQRAGTHVLVSQIVSENLASLSMAQRMGFERVGTLREVGRKFDRWLDVVLLERILAEGA